MLNKFHALGFLMVVVFSCKNMTEPIDSESVVNLPMTDANLDWISGTWIDSTSFKMINQTYVEVWKVLEKDSYEGIKYSIKGGKNGDTTSLKIDKSEGKLYYTIEGDKKSTFIQTKGASNEIEFANTKDEFPYNINYLNDNNKLTITASGNLNGEQRVIKFNTLKK